MDDLEADLQGVAASLVRMLSLVRESNRLARRVLIDADPEALAPCLAEDEQIDALEASLEARLLSALRQGDRDDAELRFLLAVHHAISDVERAGDYAVHVARTGAELAQTPRLKKYLDMARIHDILETMLDTTLAALADGDAAAARRARAMDDEIDELYEQIQRELLTVMIEDPSTITTASKLLAVGRYLERLGDHVENVDEHLLFWLEGERP